MSKLILGKQELLILLVDLSASMYIDNERKPVNKYQQVQSAIQALVKRINSTNKANHILISIVLFAERGWIVEIENDISLYNYSKDWLNIHNLENFFSKINTDHVDRKKRIGNNTSIVLAFDSAKKIIDLFFADNNIAPENRKGVSIMLFSDGVETTSENLMSSLEGIKISIENAVKGGMVNSIDKNNLGISTISIGKDADNLILKSISTPYTEKQKIHIRRIRENDINISSRVDPLKCFLKLNASNNCIDDIELSILRKFLYLVTDTPV